MKSKVQSPKSKARKVRACRRCGCTHYTPCDVGGHPCGWAERDLCTACLLPDEKRRFVDGDAHPSRPTQRQIADALKLQIETLRDSFRGVNGYFTEAKYAKECECLQAALKIVRAL